MTVVRWVGRVVGVLVGLVALVFLGARLHDGPLGPIPGGPLEHGELVTTPVTDWTFAADVPEIELQLLSQARSRTTWILVQDGKAYVPAATQFPPGKTWHKDAVADGRAVLRITGKRYPVTLTKTDDPTVASALRGVAEKKYPSRPGGEVWLFAVSSRVPH